MNSEKNPIITRYIEQKCISYREGKDCFVSIIQNVAIDTEGKTWRFKEEYIHRNDNRHGSYSYCSNNGYDFQEIKNA